MPQRRLALGRERVDQLVGFARLHDLTALNVAPIAESRELAINLLMVSSPEEPDRRIERLGEFVARHRTFRQANKDRVTERHFDPSLHFRLTICTNTHMRQCA